MRVRVGEDAAADAVRRVVGRHDQPAVLDRLWCAG
jgi:hypothetical protein